MLSTAVSGYLFAVVKYKWMEFPFIKVSWTSVESSLPFEHISGNFYTPNVCLLSFVKKSSPKEYNNHLKTSPVYKMYMNTAYYMIVKLPHAVHCCIHLVCTNVLLSGIYLLVCFQYLFFCLFSIFSKNCIPD